MGNFITGKRIQKTKGKKKTPIWYRKFLKRREAEQGKVIKHVKQLLVYEETSVQDVGDHVK